MLKRVMIQGSHQLTGNQVEAIQKMIAVFKTDANWIAQLGAYGQVVEAVTGTGMPCEIHRMDQNRAANIARGAQVHRFVDCSECAKPLFLDRCPDTEDVPASQIKAMAWGVRMGFFLEGANAYAFFPGGPGTLAHLVPVLAHQIKGGDPKPVALIGWDVGKVAMLSVLMDSDLTGEPWCRIHLLEHAHIAAEWIMAVAKP